LTAKTSRAALALAQHDGFAFYDALIVAAAIEAGCDTPYSEGMQHGRSIDGLTIVNPFLGSMP
jgi:predicted nucleic acid-binding protein